MIKYVIPLVCFFGYTFGQEIDYGGPIWEKDPDSVRQRVSEANGELQKIESLLQEYCDYEDPIRTGIQLTIDEIRYRLYGFDIR
jgi:hypothetical protein